MRVLTLTPWFPAFPGDQTGSFVFDSIDAVRSLGHDCVAVVSQPWRPKISTIFSDDWRRPVIEPARFPCKLDIQVIRHLSIPRNHFRFVTIKLFENQVGGFLARQIQKFRPDIIHAHTEWAGCPAVQVAKNHGIPVVVTMHGVDLHPRLNTPSQILHLQRWLSQAKKIILVGESLEPHFATILGSDRKFVVVENGFRLWDAESVAPGKWDKPIKLVSVSNLHEGKGIEITLAALANLKSRMIDNWHYKIVGDGAERESLQQMVASYGLNSNVEFAGRCQQKQVAHELNNCNIFVLPSYREAFGISYLEAMAVGLLAIGVKGQGPEAFIKDGENGFLVEPRSVESLADCLERALSTPLEMQVLATAGQIHVRNNYSMQNHGQRLVSVYQDAIDSNA